MIEKLKKAKIAFGTYKIFNVELMSNALRLACELEYDFIDSAVLYLNEDVVGEAILNLRKEEVKILPIQSKIWPSDFHKGALEVIQTSLKRLHLKKFASYLIHRPHVDMSENVKIWKELIEIQKSGLIDVIGVSNFDRDQIEVLFNETGVYPQTNQIEASLTYLRKDRIVYNQEKGIILQGWRPFGRYQELKDHPFLKELSVKYNCKISHLFVAYAIGWGFISVMRSSVSEEIKDNKIASQLEISKDDLVKMEQVFNSHVTTTHNGCDSFANLSLDDEWYKTH